MRTIIIIAILCFVTNIVFAQSPKLSFKQKVERAIDFSDYEFHWTDVLHFSGATLVGIGHGWREASIAYGTDLDNALKVPSVSYFGSQSWKLNRFPDGSLKPQAWNFLRSGKHGVRTIGTGIVITSAFGMGLDKRDTRRIKYFKMTCESIYIWGLAGVTFNLLANMAGR